MTQSSKPAQSNEPKGAGALLAVCCLVWLVVCLGALYWLLQATLVEGKIAADVLQWTVWPFVTLSISVPILIVIFASGQRVLSQLVAVKGMVDNLGPNLEKMKDFSNTVEVAIRRMEAASAQTANAVETGAVQAISNSAPADKKRLAERLMEHYYDAKEIYGGAAERYGPELLTKTRGYLDPFNVDLMRDDRKLNKQQADYVKAVLSVEAGSRRDGRKSLTEVELKKLDDLKPV